MKFTTFIKNEKKIEPIVNEDVVNKAYLDENLLEEDGHFSYVERGYNELKLQYKKQSVEETLIQRAVKTTIRKLFDKGFFDGFSNADEVLKDFLFVKRRRVDLVEKQMMLFKDFVHKYKLKNKATKQI